MVNFTIKEFERRCCGRRWMRPVSTSPLRSQRQYSLLVISRLRPPRSKTALLRLNARAVNKRCKCRSSKPRQKSGMTQFKPVHIPYMKSIATKECRAEYTNSVYVLVIRSFRHNPRERKDPAQPSRKDIDEAKLAQQMVENSVHRSEAWKWIEISVLRCQGWTKLGMDEKWVTTSRYLQNLQCRIIHACRTASKSKSTFSPKIRHVSLFFYFWACQVSLEHGIVHDDLRRNLQDWCAPSKEGTLVEIDIAHFCLALLVPP